jgi:hypothetical protein
MVPYQDRNHQHSPAQCRFLEYHVAILVHLDQSQLEHLALLGRLAQMPLLTMMVVYLLAQLAALHQPQASLEELPPLDPLAK